MGFAFLFTVELVAGYYPAFVSIADVHQERTSNAPSLE